MGKLVNETDARLTLRAGRLSADIPLPAARALTSISRHDFQERPRRLCALIGLAMTRTVSKTTSKSLAAAKGGATH